MEVVDTNPSTSIWFYAEVPYFVQKHSGLNSTCTEQDIIKMLEFLVNNIFLVFTGTGVFKQNRESTEEFLKCIVNKYEQVQQIVGIPIGNDFSISFSGRETSRND